MCIYFGFNFCLATLILPLALTLPWPLDQILTSPDLASPHFTGQGFGFDIEATGLTCVNFPWLPWVKVWPCLALKSKIWPICGGQNFSLGLAWRQHVGQCYENETEIWIKILAWRWRSNPAVCGVKVEDKARTVALRPLAKPEDTG